MSSGNPELDKKIAEWLSWDKNEKTNKSIKELVDLKKYDELEKLLLKRLSFGTAGLRGRMGPGYAAMNDLVIIQTGQGLLKYLEENENNLLTQNGIVVGYDGRHNSKIWAEITSCIFVHKGYKVRLFSRLNPTPFVAFATGKYNAAIGVMVTASHNPKEDNGYKVYCPIGTQIISPVDKNIQTSIINNLEPLATSWDTSILKNSPLCIDPLEEVLCDYTNRINATIIPEHKEINKKLNKLFVYTAMHGVGYYYIQKIFDVIGVQIIPVPEQQEPDPDFPTVKLPNPEEGKSAMDLSIRTANQNNSTVILANDPDADRFAAAEKNKEYIALVSLSCTFILSFKIIFSNCEWKVFTGNELGALLGWWIYYCFKLKNPDFPLNDLYMISSTVSSMILKSISKKEGFQFIETLTGFKWMGNKAVELMKQNKKVLFAFEESIGYMCTTNVLDKDGISAAFQFATLTSFLYNNNMTLVDKLQEIYGTYGQHLSMQSYYFCYDPNIINNIFCNIRNYTKDKGYPTGICNDKYKIKAVRDLTTGYDDNQPDKKAVLPVDPKTHMITFHFENGMVCTMRTSGTEPKIKYYTELCASPEIKDVDQLKNVVKEMVTAICEEFLEPEKNKLVPKAD